MAYLTGHFGEQVARSTPGTTPPSGRVGCRVRSSRRTVPLGRSTPRLIDRASESEVSHVGVQHRQSCRTKCIARALARSLSEVLYANPGLTKVSRVPPASCHRLIRFGACAAAAFLAVHPTATHAQLPTTRHDIDRNHSAVYVVTSRSGLLSFLGHDHAILAREWQGSLCIGVADTLQGRGSITVQAASLEIDSDSARKLAGLGRGPSADQRRSLQETLLDERHLAAAMFPVLMIHVDEIVTVGGSRTAQGRITIRGRTHDVEFPIEAEMEGDAFRITGVLHVTQSEFGIRPESIAGLVKVADVVAIHFDILALNTHARCR
jgi:polyisoprenoid-binding protein YceI